MKIHQAHDKLFKETFSDVEVARGFLQHYLPPTSLKFIDVMSLKMLNDSFIEEQLLDSRSDLLYEATINGEKAYVYFLFEHKSYPTKDIALQLLGYMVEIWKREFDKKKTDVLPLVMPLVIYHGKFLWSEPKQLRDWFINYDELSEEMTKYVPDFEFTLYDFSYANELDVKGEPKLRAYLQLMQHIFLKDWAKLIQVIVEIETLLLSRGYEKIFQHHHIIYLTKSRKCTS